MGSERAQASYLAELHGKGEEEGSHGQEVEEAGASHGQEENEDDSNVGTDANEDPMAEDGSEEVVQRRRTRKSHYVPPPLVPAPADRKLIRPIGDRYDHFLIVYFNCLYTTCLHFLIVHFNCL